MKNYLQAIKDFYSSARRDLRYTDEIKNGIEEIVRTYQDKEGFHHVLTELAFLEIRCVQEDGHHSVIPVVFNGDGIRSLPLFSSGVPLWLTPQRHGKSLIHKCQASHRLLFNLLRQIYPTKHRAIDEFNNCYEKCVELFLPGSSQSSRETFEDKISVEIKLTVDRLIKHGLAIIRTGEPGMLVFGDFS
jgi:hypothetical protein